MGLAAVREKVVKMPLEETERCLFDNFRGLDWEIEHSEELFTKNGSRVKIYIGVCASYSGVSLVSFMYHGGGHVPYYVKLEEYEFGQTQITVVVTGSETVHEDRGGRNGNLAEFLVEMCEKDCTHKSLMEKAHDFLGLK